MFDVFLMEVSTLIFFISKSLTNHPFQSGITKCKSSKSKKSRSKSDNNYSVVIKSSKPSIKINKNKFMEDS